jgi:hypothetical protein
MASVRRVQRGTLAWILAAVLGLAVAVGVMAAASHLSSQRVGLASEPPSAGSRLAPAGRPRHPAPKPRPKKVTTTTTPSAPAPTAPSQGQGDGDADADD